MEVRLEIVDIVVNSNRRKVNADAVAELAKSISVLGLLHPIVVDMDRNLIAGLHRLEAFKLLGRSQIDCNMIDMNGLQAELAEIDENFVRSPLSEMEKNDTLFRRKKIYEELYPETKKGGDRRSKKIKDARCAFDPDGPKSFSNDTAEKLGISKATVDRRIRIAENVTQDAKQVFEEAPDKYNQKELLKLTHVAPEHQKEAAKQFVSGQIKSISDYKPDTSDSESGSREQENGENRKKIPRYKDPVLAKIVADIKDSEKERPMTTNTFVLEFNLAVKQVERSLEWFDMQQYLDIYPMLTGEQYKTILETRNHMVACVDSFLQKIQEMMTL